MGEIISLANLLEAMVAPKLKAEPWAEALRSVGRMDFASRGLPNRRVESWKYSDLARALNEPLRESGPLRSPLTVPGVFTAAFENGALDEEKSALSAAGAFTLRAILSGAAPAFADEIGQINSQDSHAILGLNTALMEEGFVLRVAKGKTLAAPLHMRFNWQGAGAQAAEGRHIRVIIVLEEGAKATLLESHSGAPGFATVVTELRLAANARLTHLRLEQLGAGARQSAATLAELGQNALYRGFYLSEGGHFARHEALLKLVGENAEAQIDGAYLASESRHCDNTTVITHAAPNTLSRQSFRGVLGGQARGVYQGCVRVDKAAQGTDARQMSRALLLSRKAEIATKPELEIFADDVKCSHGATAGELDGAALFFLRARGIPEPEARALLVEAFFVEALAGIEDETLRNLASAAVQDWLALHACEVTLV